ncbi:MAG: hypothetical protein L0229_21320 [Blastocatellia bacterium]|nr:hypothetical protein [Blastocatellia bacterium]
MARINADTETPKDIQPKSLRLSQQNSEACIQLLNEWLADESGYDEENWPKIKAMIEENRISSRTLFNTVHPTSTYSRSLF